uniref:hypothetical protein n=1 Tax=Inonotus hispidus TaxID=40469 RepID=UPI0021821B1F|nr:hypothetical protein N4M07_mgp058 [Inonotus hispidus]UVF37994.1 hypothetical protein [Inonotus hispidus]
MKNLIDKIQKYLKSFFNKELNNNTPLIEDKIIVYYHINNFYDYDFPFKIIFKFLNNIEKISENYILLDIKVKSCDYKIIVGNKHDYAFYESINSNNNNFYINNIPVDLIDDKNNIDLSCYLSKLISDYCIRIDSIKDGTSVDLFFEYKYITFEEYVSHKI